MRSYILALALLLAAPSAALAEDKLDTIASFQSGRSSINLAVFTRGPEIVGVIAVAIGDSRVAFAFHADDWATFSNLIDTAMRRNGERWAKVGGMSESGTSSPSELIVYSGPQVQLIVIDPSDGANVFKLQKSDFSAWRAAARTIGERLAAP
jgi:hypothetical protein